MIHFFVLLAFIMLAPRPIWAQAESAPDTIKYKVNPTPDTSAPGKIYIPSDLDDALRELDHMLSPSFIAEFRSDSAAPIKNHFGLGMWMRNNWSLWGGSRLSRYFHCQGIFHPDDMSGIVLDSYWRRLNSRPINLQEQIARYHAFWIKQGADSAQIRPRC